MKQIQSLLTPDLPYHSTIRGHHVFSNGSTFSIDEKLSDKELESIIDYMWEEGLIDESKDWAFLT